ncbi:hypothetical protein GCM10009717_21590 [Agromyces allii]|uniref:Uncharacterized protein n=1 Tax=Agromyces allii TaxID=393607 RepID=A0ABN2QPD3_9MICO
MGMGERSASTFALTVPTRKAARNRHAKLFRADQPREPLSGAGKQGPPDREDHTRDLGTPFRTLRQAIGIGKHHGFGPKRDAQGMLEPTQDEEVATDGPAEKCRQLVNIKSGAVRDVLQRGVRNGSPRVLPNLRDHQLCVLVVSKTSHVATVAGSTAKTPLAWAENPPEGGL